MLLIFFGILTYTILGFAFFLGVGIFFDVMYTPTWLFNLTLIFGGPIVWGIMIYTNLFPEKVFPPDPDLEEINEKSNNDMGKME